MRIHRPLVIRHAYQHVCFLAQPNPEGERYLDQLSFEDEQSSALDGTMVWKVLVERDKALDAGQFGAKALLHNLREGDHGRSLSDILAAFYNAPRMPLRYGGDQDLQQAIYDAVVDGLLNLVDVSGASVAITAPGQVNLASTGLRFAKSAPKPEPGGEDLPPEEGGEDKRAIDDPREGEGQHPKPADRQVAFSFTRNLLASPVEADRFAELFMVLYLALDEHSVSYAQGSLQVVVDPSTAEKVRVKREELGLSATVKDL